jgi:hypothetical protein
MPSKMRSRVNLGIKVFIFGKPRLQRTRLQRVLSPRQDIPLDSTAALFLHHMDNGALPREKLEVVSIATPFSPQNLTYAAFAFALLLTARMYILSAVF